MTLHEQVPAALAGQRLDRVVAMVADCSRAAAAEWITTGRVQVDGTTVTTRSQRLGEGAIVAVDVPEAVDPRPQPQRDVVVPVVYEDEHVIVVDKPAGLVVHPGAGHPDGTLVNGLLAIHPEIATVGDPERPGIVHRLDAGTSGLLMVARTADAYGELVAALARREVERRYLALVHGHLESTEGVVDAPIGRSSGDATKMAVTAQGRDARTHYRVTARHDVPLSCSVLECRLETGRTHQIRVHLAAIGHPVVADERYGPNRVSLGLDRPFLHAADLAFVHPVTGERLGFHAPTPDDLVAVLESLGEPDEPVTAG